MISAKRAELFEDKVLYCPMSGCHLWTGAMTGKYGSFNCPELGGKSRAKMAHVVAWVLAGNDKPSKGFELDHLCKDPRCVNVQHLELVPKYVNNMRSDSVCAKNARKTHCVRGHKFTPETTLIRYDKGGGRQCKVCDRERAMESYYRQREVA